MNYSLLKALSFTLTLLGLSLPVLAQDHNSNRHSPPPGWSQWKPRAEIPQADFDAGFSNLELGGFLEFQHTCVDAMGIPPEKAEEVPYQFRLSNLVEQIGTGEVEFGCFVNGQPVFIYTMTAINTQFERVTCLEVNSPIGNGLIIRSDGTTDSQRLGVVANGQVVNPGSYPASVVQRESRHWVHILSPEEGWVSQGQPGSQGNLKLC